MSARAKFTIHQATTTDGRVCYSIADGQDWLLAVGNVVQERRHYSNPADAEAMAKNAAQPGMLAVLVKPAKPAKPAAPPAKSAPPSKK